MPDKSVPNDPVGLNQKKKLSIDNPYYPSSAYYPSDRPGPLITSFIPSSTSALSLDPIRSSPSEDKIPNLQSSQHRPRFYGKQVHTSRSPSSKHEKETGPTFDSTFRRYDSTLSAGALGVKSRLSVPYCSSKPHSPLIS